MRRNTSESTEENDLLTLTYSLVILQLYWNNITQQKYLHTIYVVLDGI